MDGSGQDLHDRLLVPRQCTGLGDRNAVTACLDRLGFRNVLTYHPASQYWRFQLTQAALFTGLAAILVTVAVVHLLRRDA